MATPAVATRVAVAGMALAAPTMEWCAQVAGRQRFVLRRITPAAACTLLRVKYSWSIWLDLGLILAFRILVL